jgi:SAM-dependent methyltransferase
VVDPAMKRETVATLRAQLDRAQEASLALESLIQQLEAPECAETGRDAVDGRNPYIPLSRPVFAQLLLRVRELVGRRDRERLARFVDVGCGLGDKVFLAKVLGFEGHGIEYDQRLVRRAKRLHAMRESRAKAYAAPEVTCGWEGAPLTVYAKDALEFDYGEFDVIYLFRPFADDALEARLEERIWRQARPGAVVVLSLGLTRPRGRAFRCHESRVAPEGRWEVWQRAGGKRLKK